MSDLESLSELKKRIAVLPPDKRSRLEQQLQQRGLTLELPILRRQNLQDCPLSLEQQRLWFLHQIEGSHAAYNIAIGWKFTGSLDAAVLEDSLNAIVQRHESLRTSFDIVEEKPKQIIAEALNLSIAQVDLRSLSASVQQVEIDRLAKQEAQRSFDLTCLPLLRSTLLHTQFDQSVLLLTLHHSIADGWSRGILLQELFAVYRARICGEAMMLPTLPIQYVDFAVWQRQWLQSKAMQNHLAYWQRQLADLPHLELPIDRLRPAVAAFHGASQSCLLSSGLLADLKGLSQRSGVTLFMTLLAAFQILLHRYSGQDDVAVGVPIANRHRPETQGLIGFFVNTLVLRTDLSRNPSFAELLKRVQQTVADGFTHQDVPFALVVEALQPQRSLSHNPLFQVMFQLQNEAYQLQNSLTPALSIPGLKLEQTWIDSGTTKFDLTWHLVERSNGLLLVVEYRTDLFAAATIDRMMTHFQVLLTHLHSHLDQPLSELPWLTAAERDQMLVGWNQPLGRSPLAPFHCQFEAQAQRTPAATAVVCGDESLTYGQLNRRANQVAHHLRSFGVQPEAIVGVCLPPSTDLPIALIGILKAGAAYLPIDPQLPSDRIAYMLSDAQVALIIAEPQALSQALMAIGVPIVSVNDCATALPSNLDTDIAGDHLAYVIYTSGSTGRPKGTLLTHQGLANYLHWCVQAYPIAEGWGAPVQSSIGFDATITSLFVPLLVGRAVCLLAGESEIELLYDAIYTDRLWSLMKLTPAHLSGLSQRLALEPALPAIAVRAFVIGGEALTADHLAFWQQHAPQTRLINEYGPTEAVVGCCTYDATAYSDTIPIGRPIPNTQLYVLDRYLQPVAVGVPGELYIGGMGVARGYLNRPDLTAERFLPNPFAEGRLYKTGDRVSYRSDGAVVYLGRADQQVNLRGFRIELEEVASVLRQHSEVQEAIALLQSDSQMPQIVAYVLPRSGAVAATNLREFLRSQLPDYMLPARIVEVSTLPLTLNGKIDRAALMQLDCASASVPSLCPPQTVNEGILVNIWTALFDRAIGIHDNFFELGGDSILSLQMTARAQQAGVKFTPRQVFQHQTIAQLAAVAESAVSTPTPETVTGDTALTPIQSWFFEQASPEPFHYNQSILLEVVAGLRSDWIEQTLDQLLQRHDALRLQFLRSETEWRAAIAAPDSTPRFSVIDLVNLTVAEQPAAIAHLAAQLQASLDLSSGLLRSLLLHMGHDQPDRLLLVVHHLAIDGLSWQILLADFIAVYQQLAAGKTVQLPAQATAWKAWAAQLVCHAQSEAVMAELAYWRSQADSTRLPLSSFDLTEASTVQMETVLDRQQTHCLEAAQSAYRTQIHEILLTALMQSIAQWSGQRSLLIDLEGHGREDGLNLDVSRTIGWFTTIFPVRLAIESTDPIAVLKLVKERLRQIPHGGIGYGLLRYLHPDQTVRDCLQSTSPAPVKFNYLGAIDRFPANALILRLAKESIGASRSSHMLRRYPLELNGFIKDERLHLHWSYSRSDRDAIARLVEAFQQALRQLIAGGQSPQVGGYTPSDFAGARLSQAQLDQFITKIQPGKR